MANNVFANGREISCKKADGKSICCFPDVCFTPPDKVPPTPLGVPIPYPNTGMAKDCTSGSKKVKISGAEILLKNKSHFKTSVGDEAGAAQKKGVITSKTKGKVYFTAWSMDVKVEGKNAVRHLDLTTHNHGSSTNTGPWPYSDSQAVPVSGVCKGDADKEKDACKEYKPNKKDGKDVCKEAGVGSKFSRFKGTATRRSKASAKDPCMAARRCRLVPYNGEPRDGTNGCCPAQTPDHIIPKSSFYETSVRNGVKMEGWENYSMGKAPCMCLEGGSCSGSHGLRHATHKASRSPKASKGDPVTFNSEAKHCAESAAAVSGCDAKCLEAQLKHGHKGMGNQKKKVKYSPTGRNYKDKLVELAKKISDMLPSVGAAGR